MEKRVSPFRIYFRQQFLSEKWDNLSFELSDICRFYLVTYVISLFANNVYI